MLCNGDGYTREQDNSSPSNEEVAQAFSHSRNLKLHCIVNSAGRELFVAAQSCRDAKILSLHHGHLQALGNGRCSAKEMKRYIGRAPQEFLDKAKAVVNGREPGIIWTAGYFSENRDLLAKQLQT